MVLNIGAMRGFVEDNSPYDWTPKVFNWGVRQNERFEQRYLARTDDHDFIVMQHWRNGYPDGGPWFLYRDGAILRFKLFNKFWEHRAFGNPCVAMMAAQLFADCADITPGIGAIPGQHYWYHFDTTNRPMEED
jgi:hypothetical protein